MEIVFYIFCCAFGLFIGHIIAKTGQPKCTHKWGLLESKKVLRTRNNGGEYHHTGYIKFYECEYCKKLKKEQIELE